MARYIFPHAREITNNCDW